MLDSGDDARTRRLEALPRATRRSVRVVEDALAHYSLDGDSLQAAVEALRELLHTDKVFIYSLAQRPGSDDLMVARDATAAYPHARWRAVFEDFLRGRGVTWSAFNPLRPEPEQRDRVLRRDEIAALTNGRNLAVDKELGEKLGTFGEDTMRVLVCDGPSMLAWLGIIQPEKTTEAQRALLDALVPAFRKRLQFERFVGESAFVGDALACALEHVNGAAWVLEPRGRILHANAAGRARFDADRTSTLAALDACVAGTADPRFKVTPLRNGEGPAGHMIVELPDRAAVAGIPEAARRFGLTAAQTRVLERVLRGMSNAAIAAELAVAERTVEAHVTALLLKAQVSSRAALIVQVFKDTRTT